MYYLAQIDQHQTLSMYSGHPMGLFPSFPSSPRVIISNGMVINNYSRREDYDRMFALGVSMYGQMTAGSFCYIGPQGIVHGTTLTILNAGRKYLGTNNLKGKVFVTSGLGGMSGAQAKAATICGCIGVIAEVSKEALFKRKEQGWVNEVIDDLEELIEKIKDAKANKYTISYGFHGNVVSLWERLVMEYKNSNNLLVELGSDQTSCHNPFNGGYYPVQITYEESQNLIKNHPQQFKQLCKESLIRQIEAINFLSKLGMHFWDYGNAFLLEAYRAGADLQVKQAPYGIQFKYPSYIQHILGDIFCLGFGPFRWICTSCNPEDLEKTDEIALNVLNGIINEQQITKNIKDQYRDNIKWLEEAGKNKLVVGSQARILYSDERGRIQIALAFNQAVKAGIIKSPIVISRDHHDVSGADSPYRETSNVYDGSSFTADMAINTVIGNAARGATWVAVHNGGGVGWGEVINCGFGLVLDGSQESQEKAKVMLSWDVNNGLARRSWAGNGFAKETITRQMQRNDNLVVTLPNEVDEQILKKFHSI